jgi:small GTP-binding protein
VDEYDYLFKCVAVGDGGCGKTALVVRFSQGFFQEQYKLTIGVEFAVKSIEVKGYKIKLQVWDTGGQERFQYVRPLYYKGSMGAVVVFDLTNRESFDHIPKWIEEVRANSKNIPMLLLGNKSDLVNERVVSREEAENFAKELDMFYMESSAKSGDGVGDVFAVLGLLMIGEKIPPEMLESKAEAGTGPSSPAQASPSLPSPSPAVIPKPTPSPGAIPTPSMRPAESPSAAFSPKPAPAPTPSPAFNPHPEEKQPEWFAPSAPIRPAKPATPETSFTPSFSPTPPSQSVTSSSEESFAPAVPKRETPSFENSVQKTETPSTPFPSKTPFSFSPQPTAMPPKPASSEPTSGKFGGFLNALQGKIESDQPAAQPKMNFFGGVPTSPAVAKSSSPFLFGGSANPKPVSPNPVPDQIICPKCKATLSKSFKFCNKCGTRLQ